MKTIEFRNADPMPILGLGTWKSGPGEVYRAVKAAVEMGYRHIDCAPIYGNEPEIGRALGESLGTGGVSRGQMWVTSKLWNDAHAPEDVAPALERTLDDLRLDSLDLFLIHWPVAFQKGVQFAGSGEEMIAPAELPAARTWEAMEDLVDRGLCRHIGVCNFSVPKLEALMENARIRPEMNQVELHPYLQQPDMVDFCRKSGIALTAYSPLGSPDRPAGLKAADEPVLLADPVIADIARRRDVTPAQVLIAWAIHRGTAVIPKSVRPERLAENLAAADVLLADDDLAALDALDRHRRYVSGEFFVLPDGPYTMADLWDE